jgi:hypothetical protein
VHKTPDPQQVQRSQPPSSKSKSARSASSRTGWLGTNGTYVRTILFSPGRTTFQRVNWTEGGKPVSVTLPTQVPPGGYLVDMRSSPLPIRDPGRAEFFHPAPNPRRWFPNGDVQSNRLVPGRIQRQRRAFPPFKFQIRSRPRPSKGIHHKTDRYTNGFGAVARSVTCSYRGVAWASCSKNCMSFMRAIHDKLTASWYHCYRRFQRDHVIAYYTNYRMTVLQLVKSYDRTVEV